MLWKHYLVLAKPRLTAMVLATTAVGYVLASAGSICWTGLLLTVLGTGLAAVAAGTFNQVIEADRDAKMERTRRRPLPAGRISPAHAFLLAGVATVAGFGVLGAGVNLLTALLGLANVAIYALLYTPLKSKTPLSTLVGAVCGAMPPLMGWTGAAGHVAPQAVLLAAILFVWQVPHSLSLAWLYRSDYRRAGHHLLPVVDRTGRLTCLMIVAFALALLPLCLSAVLRGAWGPLFAALSLPPTSGLLALAVRLSLHRSRRNARNVFLATVACLPLVLLLLVAVAAADHHLTTTPAAASAAVARTRP